MPNRTVTTCVLAVSLLAAPRCFAQLRGVGGSSLGRTYPDSRLRIVVCIGLRQLGVAISGYREPVAPSRLKIRFCWGVGHVSM